MGWINYEHNGNTHRVAIARDQGGVWIAWPGGTAFVEKQTRHRGGAGHHDGIRAPMTGRIVRIAVEPKAAVVAGDLLVILEAMKMEYRLTAPHGGIVEVIHCHEGELVDLGKTLIELVE